MTASTKDESRSRLQARWVTRFLDANFIWVLLALLGVGATFSNPVFLTPNNIFNVLGAAAPLGMLVLAQSVVLISGHFDLATESNMIFVAVLSGRLLLESSVPWPLIVVIMLASGAAVGLVNGLLIVKLRMNAFMVTLGMSVSLSGLALIVGRAQQLTEFPAGFRWLGSETIFRLPVSAIFLVLVFAGAHVLFTRTVFGRSLFAVGSNRRAARAAGVPDDRIVMIAYVASGTLSAVAAFLLVGRLGVATAGISSGALFASIAAAVVGGVSLLGGQGTVPGMLGGLLLLSFITNALNLSNVAAEQVSLITGVVILIAVFIDALRDRQRRSL